MGKNRHNHMPTPPFPFGAGPTLQQFNVRHVDSPLAAPSTVVLQNAGAVNVVTIGGQSRVEALAGQIAAALAQSRDRDLFGSPTKCWQNCPGRCADIARDAVAIARAVMAELTRPPETPSDAPTPPEGEAAA